MTRFLFATLIVGRFVLTGVHDEDTMRLGIEVCHFDGGSMFIVWIGFGFGVGIDSEGTMRREMKDES